MSAGLLLMTVALLIGCDRTRGHEPTPESAPSSSSAVVPNAGEPVRVVDRTTYAMRTLFTISVPSTTDSEQARLAVKAAFQEIRRVEQLMTTWDPDSHLSQVNAQAGIEPVTVPPELVGLIVEAKRITQLTHGKFDVAAAALEGLWSHKRRPPGPPHPKEVARRLPLIDSESIVVDRYRSSVYLAKPGMRVGLGAIAKGYAVDRAGKVLSEHQLHDYIVNGGGDVLFSGRKGGQPWTSGVRDPRSLDHPFAQFDIRQDGAVCTSGDYQKYFLHQGTRYHHILDPDTGYPARGVVSATVFAPTALVADALATGVFVLGAQRGMQLIESDPALEAIIVDEQLQVHVSSGLKPYVELTPIAAPPTAPSADPAPAAKR